MFDDYSYDVFDDIVYDDDPSQIKTVSMFRHYVNCHGVTGKLLKHFNQKNEQIFEQIYDYCYGSLNVREVLKHLEIIEKCKIEKNAKETARIKNEELVCMLHNKRNNFCNLGTRRIKLFLNKLIEQGDKVAEMYRLALETEDENIKAKENRYYADKHYNKKRELINSLINLCKENDVIYGIQDSDVKDTNCIIYFDLPDCDQISFHNSFENMEDIPKYKNEWDGIPCSTLPKIEQAILKHYPEKIKDLIEKYNNKK